MTSIITFQLDKGNQRIVIGDTQHTYRASTYENSKIFPLKDKKLIFCGAGNDKIIDGVNTIIVSIDDLDFCSTKITQIKEDSFEGKFALHDLDEIIRLKEIHETSFILIDSVHLNGKKIINNIPNDLKDMEIIGSGEEFIGLVSEIIRSLYDKKFDNTTEKYILQELLKILCILGKQDSGTGHPSTFKIEGYLLEKTKMPKKINIKFKHKVQELQNYDYEVKEE